MSGILQNIYHEKKNLKYLTAYQILNSTIGLGYDVPCEKSNNPKCGTCHLEVKDDKTILYEFKEQLNITAYDGIFLCHFQNGKKAHLHPKSTYPIKNASIDDVLSAVSVEACYSKGWSLTSV
jgi:hypothetical protein